MSDSSTRCKRILDPQELIDLCDFFKSGWMVRTYKGYEKWLNKATSDLDKGYREIHGMFKAEYRVDGPIFQSVVGGFIINLVVGDNLEVKSYYTSDEENDESLLNYLEKVASERGYKGIYSTVPRDQDKLLMSFIKQRYIVSGISDKYSPEFLNYNISKKIKPQFVGDAMDWVGAVKWYLDKNFPKCNIVKEEENNYKVTLSSVDDLKLETYVYIADTYIPQEVKTKPFMAFIRQNEKYPSILTINEKELSRDNYLCYDYVRSEIGGLIVSIDEKYYDRANKNETFAFVKGGRTGIFVKKGDLIIFNRTTNSQDSNRIVAYGIIKETSIGTPEEVWKWVRYKKPLFEKREYDDFSSLKERLLSIEVESMYNFDDGYTAEELISVLSLDVSCVDLNGRYISKRQREVFESERKLKKSRDEKLTKHYGD